MTETIKILKKTSVFITAVLVGFIFISAGNFTENETKKSELNTMEKESVWKAGISRRVITPATNVWLAGYGTKRSVEKKLHDIWVKVLALEAKNGKRAVLVTTDNQGMSRIIYENIYSVVHERFQLDRSEFMLSFSHNHSGPRLRGDLVDYYPKDDTQERLVDEYSDWMEGEIVKAVDEALNNLQPVFIAKGEGECSFAVNRRDNKESEVPEILASGGTLKGVTDHYVPVLTVKNTENKLLAVIFGYACHPTTLSGNLLLGDYPGFAQINIEAGHQGVTAMFVNTCGADQNPLPRRTVELCENYGKMLSDAVEEVLAGPMQPIISNELKTSFKFVKLDYEEVVTKEQLLPLTTKGGDIQSRWARRMLDMIDKGVIFPESYNYYPVQAWQLGNELLLIGMGGETVVDYSLRFKREFGQNSTWVLGYTNTLTAYIPSRRVWEEGGYEGGPHLDEYGHPAWKWAGNTEERIASGIDEIVRQVKNTVTE